MQFRFQTLDFIKSNNWIKANNWYAILVFRKATVSK